MAAKTVDESKMMLRMSDFTSEPKRMLPPIKGYEKEQLVSLEQAVKPIISLVSDIEEMVWTVKQNCQDPHDHLSSDESASIMLYTLEWMPREQSFYFILNKALRSQNRQELLPWFLFLRLFMFALAKLPPTKHRIVYRGIKMDVTNEFPEGKTFIWWAFSSCSSSIKVLEQFLGETGHQTIFNIECDSAKDISQHSFYQSENEVLMYPARQFQVISSFNSGKQLKIIHLKEIQPPFPLIHIPQTSSPVVDRGVVKGGAPPLEKKCLEGTKGLKNYSQEQRFSPLACTPLRKFLATPLVVDQIKEIQPSLSVMQISQTSSTNSYQNKRLQQLIEQCKSRSAVNLERQNLTDEDMEIVVQAVIINKQCKVLELSNNTITSVGVSIIAGALSNNTTLEELYLMGNRLYDKGVQALTKILSLNNSKVDYLDVQSTGITDEEAGYIAEMLKINTTLGYLLLSNNEISDRGFQQLANVLTHHNTTIRSLFVGRNKLLSDSSVDALVDMLKENLTLNSLNIEKCKLSEKEKERLRQVVRSKKDFNLQV